MNVFGPIPSIEYQNGYDQFLSRQNSHNALTKQRYENQIAKSNAQYAPYLNYANSLSKTAFGQNAQANAIGSILQSPAAANMSPELYTELVKKQQESLKNNNLNFIPQPQQGNNSNSNGNDGFFGNKLAELIAKMSPYAQNALNQNPQQGMQQNNNIPQQNNNVSPPSPGYQTQFSQQANGREVPGTMGANNPSNINAAQAEAMKRAAAGQVENQNQLQKTRSALVSQQSQAATQALKTLKAYHRNYKKSSYKGQYLGANAENIPSPPGGNVSPEQLANRYANQYLTDLSGLGDTPAGKTDDGRELIAGGKPDLSLDEDAQNELYESNEAKLKRIINSRDFVNDFYRKNPGATDEELVGLMNAYNRYAPSYDYEKGKALPQNDKKFRDFTSTEALKSYRENGDYNPYANKEKNYTEKGFNKKVLNYTEDDYKHTAEKYHMSVEEVKKFLGVN